MVHTDRRPRHPGAMSAQDRPARAGGRLPAMLVCLLVALACLPAVAIAEDGYDLWLRYRPVEAGRSDEYRARFTRLVAPAATATQRATRDELLRGLGGLLGQAPALTDVRATLVGEFGAVFGRTVEPAPAELWRLIESWELAAAPERAKAP